MELCDFGTKCGVVNIGYCGTVVLRGIRQFFLRGRVPLEANNLGKVPECGGCSCRVSHLASHPERLTEPGTGHQHVGDITHGS